MAIIPIYNSKGDPEAFMEYPYIFNCNGDWVGWVTPRREIYSVIGNYVGYLTNDPRVLANVPRPRSNLDFSRLPCRGRFIRLQPFRSSR